MIKKLICITLWLLINSTCYGFIVTVDLIWNNPLSTYNLQEGSIVQIIAYDHRDASRPSNGAINNFNEIENNVFDSSTTPFNHDIVATSTLDDQTFHISFYLTDSIYTRIYVRIIESIDSDDTLSYWGLTSVHNIPQNGHPWSTVWRNEYAEEQDTFAGTNDYFEVIPEPMTIVLVLTGIGFLLGYRKI